MVKEMIKAAENGNVVKFNNLTANYIAKKLGENATIKQVHSQIEHYSKVKNAYEDISKQGE